MSDFMKWLKYQPLADIAGAISQNLKVANVTAVGFASYDEDSIVMCGNTIESGFLGDPEIVVVRNEAVDPEDEKYDPQPISQDDFDFLVAAINGAASERLVGLRTKYSTEKYHVIAYSIRNEHEYLGVMFVAICAKEDPMLSEHQQSMLAEQIESDIEDVVILQNTDDDHQDNNPMVGWYYGTFFGDLIFDKRDSD